MRNLFQTALWVVILASLTSASLAQDKTRSITSDDFTNKRPEGKKGGGKVTGSTGRAGKGKGASDKTYNLVRQEKNKLNWKPSKPRPSRIKVSGPARFDQIGLTIWRLRPPRNETGAKMLPVLEDDGVTRMWIPERVSATEPFRVGDRVRLAVESPIPGHLYVINSEMYSDGTFGRPKLIFPESLEQSNSIRPGMLVDFPDQTDDFPYFRISPKKANHIGELLVIVVSPEKLGFIVDSENWISNAGDVIRAETEFETEVFDRADNTNKVYTQAEAAAACGSKSRQLEREKSAKPCGPATRELTREQVGPQAIYRVKSQTGQPAVVFVRLNAAQ